MAIVGVPVGLVDPQDVREILESLRHALARGPVLAAPPAAALAYDMRRIAGSVTDVLAALAGIDVEAKRALVGFSVPLQDRQHALRVRGTIEELTALWRTRVQQSLGTERLTALRSLLREESPELLDIFRKRDDENAHSDVLRWLLDPRDARTVAPVALSALAKRLTDSERWTSALEGAIAARCLTVRREFVFGMEWQEEQSRDRIDLFISGPGFVLAIENKVWAVEHDEQTRAYWQWLSSLPDLHAGIFLSPTGMPAACPEFAPLSYLDLVACLLEAPVRGALASAERIVLSGYLKTLARGVLRAELQALMEEEP